MDIELQELQSLRALLDREAIRDAVLRYTRGIDRDDETLMVSAFHEDARDDHGSFIGMVRDFPSRKSRTNLRWSNYQHYVSNQTIEIKGDEAHVETYFLASLTRPTGTIDLTGGRYTDRMERRGGNWAIADRIVIVEWAGSLPSGSATSISGSLFVNSTHDRSDPSYCRPLMVTRRHRDQEA
jgi:hypothetical protein